MRKPFDEPVRELRRDARDSHENFADDVGSPRASQAGLNEKDSTFRLTGQRDELKHSTYLGKNYLGAKSLAGAGHEQRSIVVMMSFEG